MDVSGIISQLKSERDRISQAIAALEGAVSPRPQAQGQKRGKLSAAGRKRISEAMKKRWAARRATSKKTAAPKASAGRKRGGLTAAGRRRLSELMKKRWAERRQKGS